uniref:Sm domain-containing protein n=1 Tax=Marmota marmota marmota TaxID=9994 RepID=A0A8C5ZLG2_MARMA
HRNHGKTAASGRNQPAGPCGAWLCVAPAPCSFTPFFKSFVVKDVIVELKNDLSIHGILHSVDQYLNIKLTSMLQTLGDILTLSVKNCFIQRSVVHYVQLPADKLDVQLLQDAARMKPCLQQKPPVNMSQ